MTTELGWPTWIGIVADDLGGQRRFYREVLGLTELGEGAGWVQFDLGGDRLLEIVQRSGEPQYDQVRYQVGYTVEDIEATRERLIGLGVEVVSELEGEAGSGRRWCYFRDAEGNVFELKEHRGAVGAG